MRDPKRIDKFCNKLAKYWKKVPDWRFGQLIFNVLETEERIFACKLFGIEDEEMSEIFKKYFKGE